MARARRRTAALGCLVTLALLLLACESATQTGQLRVVLSADRTTVSPTEPITFQARAENRGPSRIEWGVGSSSCQLHAVILVGTVLRPVPELRACTEDLSPQGLDGFELRSEEWQWDGHVVGLGGELQRLRPGDYSVRAHAGEIAMSPPITITVR